MLEGEFAAGDKLQVDADAKKGEMTFTRAVARAAP